MTSTTDITGQKFNRLTAIKMVGKKNGQAMWLCMCDCGNETVANIHKIVTNHTRSCGCWLREARYTAYRSHGQSNKRGEYCSWGGMKQRCYYKKHKSYKNYGGRGIKVCDRWLNSFENFLVDMGNKPSPTHSLERIDNDGNYEPSNCKWESIIGQSRNKRRRLLVAHEGRDICFAEWCEINNIDYMYAYGRYKYGKSLEDILNIENPKRP